MGRRERDANMTPPTAAFAGGSGKRGYTRKEIISADHAELIKTNNVAEHEKSKSNLNASDSQLSNVSNGLGRTRKISVRRSMVSKRNSDEEDFVPEPSTSNRPDVPSTINQRPRRQVKHKFIKTGNRPSLTDELYTTLIGPNSPSAPALVPVVERLSDNVSSLAELLAAKEFKSIESMESTTAVATAAASAEEPETVEQQMAEPKSNSKDPAARMQKTLGIPTRRRRGRPARTPNNSPPTEASQSESETNHTSNVEAALESDGHVTAVSAMEDDSIVTIEETDDRFEIDSSAFGGFANAVEVSGPVDYAEEVVIEETVTTTEFDQLSYAVTCDDAVAAAESDIEPIITDEPNDVIDVSDSLSFLNDSDSDNRSIGDAPMPSNENHNENDAFDVDENSGSIILVSPSDPLEEDSIAATEEITSTTFDLKLTDDDTANDGDVEETSLNGPRRRSKRKPKSMSVEVNPVNSEAVDNSIAVMNDVTYYGASESPPKGNTFHESNKKSESTVGSSMLPQNNFVEENLISSSDETTQSESNDQSSRTDAPTQRPRRETAERVNYSVRRNYMPRQSTKSISESTELVRENIDADVDVEAELEKSVIDRRQPLPIEPIFKFNKSEQMRTYQRRQKAKVLKKDSPTPSSSSSSLSSSAPSSTSVQSSPKSERTNAIVQNTEVTIESLPIEELPSRPIVEDVSTDGQIEPTVQKRRSAGRPRKSDARRKPPQQTKLSNSIENIATNIDASIEVVETVEIVASTEQQQVLTPTETHEKIEIEFKTETDEETKVPSERETIEVMPAPAVQSPEEDELVPKVENLAISTNDRAIENDIEVAIDSAMEVTVCKMEVEDEQPNFSHELNNAEQQPLSTASTTDMVDATIAAVDQTPIADDDRMEVDSNSQIVVKEESSEIIEIPDVADAIEALRELRATQSEADIKLPNEEIDTSSNVPNASEVSKVDTKPTEPMDVALKPELVPESPSLPIVPAIPPIIPKEFLDESDDTTSIRRSGRIKTINKSKQPAQGFGLVKEKKRVNDDDLSNPSADRDSDQLNEKDLLLQSNDGFAVPVSRQKTQEELDKEQIDRGNGMKLFAQIIDNEYRSERVISKEAKKMACDCFMTQTEIERGELGCGDDCLNRMLLIECGPRCNVGDRCTNKRFQRHENADCTIFKTEKKGYGLIATSYIPAGQFIMEYVGEVLNSKQFEKRANDYSKLMNAHYYFMALSSDCVIDATKKGNISRFINHSCDPNAETQKWTVNGELRIGFFSSKAIMPDEEITFDYQFQRYGKEAQRCYCEATNCRGWIGGEPDSDEEIDDEEEEEESDEEDRTTESSEANDAKSSATSNDDVTAVKESSAQKKTKAAPKPKKPKDTTKKPVRKERAKVTRQITKDFKKRMKRSEIMEDPDLDKEIDTLALSGLKNQVHTLQFSRLMVRAKLQKAKSRLLELLRDAELPCRRLFLDYRGLKLIHSWMSDSSIVDVDRLLCLAFRLDILRTLEVLPVKNKTMLQDSKVLSTVQRWTNIVEYTSDKTNNKPTDEISPCDSGSGTPISNDGVSSPKIDETITIAVSLPEMTAVPSTTVATATTTATTPTPAVQIAPSSAVKPTEVLDAIPQILEQSSALKGLGVDMLKRIISTNEKNTKIIEDSETNDKLPDGEMGKLIREIRLLASKLVTTWEQLPESFKIPKKLRIEQMKEHEREADQSYKETVVETEKQTPTLQSAISTTFSSRFADRSRDREKSSFDSANDSKEKDPRYRRYGNTTMSKHQRRQMFEAKVAQENAERKKSLEQVTYESKCSFFKLDPRKVMRDMIPFCVNSSTGQWYGLNMKPIPTPPSHAHIKPPPPVLPTDVNEYHIPAIDLPDQWKYAINDKGQIYYYHKKIMIPQWEPPIRLLPLMQEQRVPDFDFRMDSTDRLSAACVTDDDHDMSKIDSDDDEDVVSILSNMKMNAKRLLQLKSDPILEKNIDDDSSSNTSDDSAQQELEMKLNFLKEKTDTCWENMKKLPNLSEEIAAMAKTGSSIGTSSPANANPSGTDQECEKLNWHAQSDDAPKAKKKCRDKLVQEFRISPLSEEMKRELRRDSKRYKENKAKLRRQKDSLLKRKSITSSSDAPLRKLKKITEGLPNITKFDDEDTKEVTPTPYVSTLSARISALASSGSFSSNSNSSIFKEPSSLSPSPASLTQSIVNKLPSIGHKFVSDTKELIAKNSMKPIKAAAPLETNDIISKPTVPLTKHKKSITIPPRKSSPKPVAKKKKTNDLSSEPIEAHSSAAKKIKERFRTEISGDIVRHLKPYFSETCDVGRIRSNEDFKHLARKLTFFVMLKELKYCNDVKVLEVTESVKVKAREYIKKYMSKFGQYYVRGENEQDYEDL